MGKQDCGLSSSGRWMVDAPVQRRAAERTPDAWLSDYKPAIGFQHHPNTNAMPLQHIRGDKTAIELFQAGVRGWEITIRRRFGL